MNHAVKSNENSSDGGYIKLYPSLDLDEVSCAEKCIELYASIGTNVSLVIVVNLQVIVSSCGYFE